MRATSNKYQFLCSTTPFCYRVYEQEDYAEYHVER